MRSASSGVSRLALSVLLTLAPGPIAAQSGSILSLLPTEDRSLAIGEETSGGLSSSDPLGPNGERMEAWSLDGTAGESVTIDLRSDDFDARLYVVGPGLGEGIRDEDGGAGCDARIELTFLETGTHTVVASSTFSDGTGVYTIGAHADAEPIVDYACGGVDPAALSALPTDPERVLSVGASASGTLDGDEEEIEDGRYGEAWTLEAAAGDRATVQLLSDAFDPYLYVLGPGLEPLSDDDSAGNADSRLEVTFPESGTYRIVASSFTGGEQGAYVLEVLPPLDPADLSAEGRIGMAETVSGTLSTSAPSLFDGRPAQIWEIDGEAGESVAIELRSDAFDPYLYLTGPGLDAALEDDDGAGDFDSRIEAVFPETGTYRIVVSAYSGGSSGAFELEVTPDP